MRPTKLMNHLDEAGLKKQMKASADREQFQRWQAIFLTSKGLRSEVVADYVGIAKGTIHQWVYQYNHNGPDGIFLQGRGGRRFGLLTLDEEKDLLEQIRSKAEVPCQRKRKARSGAGSIRGPVCPRFALSQPDIKALKAGPRTIIAPRLNAICNRQA